MPRKNSFTAKSIPFWMGKNAVITNHRVLVMLNDYNDEIKDTDDRKKLTTARVFAAPPENTAAEVRRKPIVWVKCPERAMRSTPLPFFRRSPWFLRYLWQFFPS